VATAERHLRPRLLERSIVGKTKRGGEAGADQAAAAQMGTGTTEPVQLQAIIV